MPESLPELSKVWKKAMVAAHPDKGGSHEQAQALNAAYSALSQSFAVVAPISVATPTAANSSKIVHPPRCTWLVPENLADPSLIADLKIDGERVVVYLNQNPYSGLPQTTLLSRYVGKHTKQYGDKSIPALAVQYPGLDGTILDGELFQGRLIVFDIPFHNGQDLRPLPLRERRKVLTKVVGLMANPLVELVQSWSGIDLLAKFQEITGMGGEGLVIKDSGAAYGVNWGKLKKSYDVSVVISGFTEGLNSLKGLVGSFKLSVYKDGKLVEVGSAKCADNQQHLDVTANRAAYLGKVIDVFAQEMTVHGKLRHATFYRMRPDLNDIEVTHDRMVDAFKQAARASRVKDGA
jgi:ATP-dependent DNA ligase